MQSTFLGIELGKRSLNAQNQALNTIGHNLANASAEGYSRQRVELGATDPLYAPDLTREETPGQIGQGVSIERIERIKDDLLEGRIDSESGLEGYWTTRDKYLLQLEQVHNEPSDTSVRTQMDKFGTRGRSCPCGPPTTPRASRCSPAAKRSPRACATGFGGSRASAPKWTATSAAPSPR